jgi:uncharacterized membrane protein
MGNAVAGTLFILSYILRSRRRQLGRRPGFLSRLLCLAGGGLSVYTGWLGGKLVEEYGEAVKPVMKRLEEEERAAREAHRPERAELVDIATPT